MFWEVSHPHYFYMTPRCSFFPSDCLNCYAASLYMLGLRVRRQNVFPPSHGPPKLSHEVELSSGCLSHVSCLSCFILLTPTMLSFPTWKSRHILITLSSFTPWGGSSSQMPCTVSPRTIWTPMFMAELFAIAQRRNNAGTQDRWMDTSNVVSTYSGMWFSL